MVQREEQLKEFFSNSEGFKQKIGSKELIVFLDYDGTLTPIVARPDLAVLDSAMRETIKELAVLVKTAIVSGRATDDVRDKVDLEGLFYAGSHGFEIVYPNGKVKINEEAQSFRPIIDEVHKKLEKQFTSIDGALAENVKYTVSAHYRLVADKDFEKFEQIVDEVLSRHPNLRKTHGKKVFEIRPQIDWDKGKAVLWILNDIAGDRDDVFPIYIGDDTTDEDAFTVLENKGAGILVAQEQRPTKAEYYIKNTDEVKKVIDALINFTKQRTIL